MRDHPPMLRRILQLKQFSMLSAIDLDELATIAENVVETTIPAGTIVVQPGGRVRAIELIVDGRIEERPLGRSWKARQVHGALEVFADRHAAYTAVAATDVVALQMSATDVSEVLEDNFSVLLAALRELGSRLLAVSPRLPRVPLAPLPERLGLVERLIVLRQQLPFTTARLQALTSLAHASEEISWPAGTVVARASEPATDGYVVISGEAIATREGSSEVLEPGAAIGLLELIAGAPHAATIETATIVRALRSPASSILDVLEDHTDVGLAMLGALSGALLDR